MDGSLTSFAMKLLPKGEDGGKTLAELGQLVVSGHRSPQPVAAAGCSAICHHEHLAVGCIWGCGSFRGDRKLQRVTLGGPSHGGQRGLGTWVHTVHQPRVCRPRTDDCCLGKHSQQWVFFP